MWPVISPNKKITNRRENETKYEMHDKSKDESFEIAKTDVLAIIIAVYQLVMPLVLILVVILIYLLMFK